MNAIMGYLSHLMRNWMVAANALLLALLHFTHGVFPSKYTSHDYFEIGLGKKGIKNEEIKE